MRLKLILASQSPRRRLLLTEAGYEFQVITPDEDAESGYFEHETVAELVNRLAYQKAENVARKIDVGFVLACDTVAECHGIVLGKPRDRRHAAEMLSLLRGQTHSVYSGICLWDVATGKKIARVVISTLFMQMIPDEELDRYLDSNLWVGKSGAFGYQDGPEWLELRAGSASNVVGLPMESLEEMIVEFNNPI